MQEIFTGMYRRNSWANKESVSGDGSDLTQTKAVRAALAELAKDLRIRTLLDAPCGDYFWMKEVTLNLTRYIGADIVPDLVEANQRRYGNSAVSFAVLDICRDALPQVDLILCRDCLVHLSLEAALSALRNFLKSGSKYLLTTTYPGLVKKNRQLIITGNWRPLDLQLQPFSLPEPIRVINEGGPSARGLQPPRGVMSFRIAYYCNSFATPDSSYDSYDNDGTWNVTDTKQRLRRLIEANCLLVGGEYILSTGGKSSYYFDCKRITLEGEGLALMADLILEEIARLPAEPAAIGGLTMGADFIVAAVAMRAHQLGRATVRGAIARKQRKRHGTRNWVENTLPTGTKIVVVDDVITKGKSTLEACDRFEEERYDIVGIIGLVDREQGGLETIRERYPRATALYRASDFPRLMEYQRNAKAQAKAAGRVSP